MTLQAQWVKCGDGSLFCPLETLDLSALNVMGVYIIWQSPSGSVIYVGQGLVSDRLSAHRNDPAILSRRGEGTIVVTWAGIDDEPTRLGVERFLAMHYKPLVGKQYQNVPPVAVNLPQ